MMKSFSFIASIGGDMECFCWKNVDKNTVNIFAHPLDEYDFDEWLYPGQIFEYLNLDKDKRYKFTINVEEI